MTKKNQKVITTEHLNQAPNKKLQKLKMRQLVDRWSFGTFFIVSSLKFLQLLKKIGIKTNENGWRRFCSVFLRNEHSKFILASFRLKYYSSKEIPDNKEAAKKILIDKLTDSLRSSPSSHWTLEPGLFRLKRKKVFFTDVIEAKFNKNGILMELIPHLDTTRETFTLLKEDLIKKALERIVKRYNINEKKQVDDHKRAWKTYKKLHRWAYRVRGLSFAGKHELCHLIERVLDATFIQFEILDGSPTQLASKRFATPKMKRKRHPGFGLLNIVCRFTADYAESDLWFQYHHVPVDALPMLEMLHKLKDVWGEVGPVKYPALNSEAAKPEILYFGNNLFRAKAFIGFEKMLRLRKYLNEKYASEMGGNASIASMLIWGLAQQKYFDGRKFIIPVDTELVTDYPQDRNLSFIIIRPSKFFNKKTPLKGFLKYQKVYNQRLALTKQCKSETYELLELYAIMHPLICKGIKHLMPKASREILGTAGLTILKDAEMVIGPLTDLHGFAAVGNLKMPTEDGKTAGAITICSTKEEVREYIKAFYSLAENFPDFLKIKLPKD